MSSNKEPAVLGVLEEDKQAILGLTKYFANVPKLTLDGVDYTPAALKAIFQGEIDQLAAIAATRATLRQQLHDSLRARKKVRGLRQVLKQHLLVVYGAKAGPILEVFGMAPPKKPGPKTTEAKAEGSAKAQATRAAKREALDAVKKKG
jgi:hypothetical protein